MHFALVPVSGALLALLNGCVAPAKEVPLAEAIRTAGAFGQRALVSGELRSVGSTLFQLHPIGATDDVTECIAVILDDRDRERLRVRSPVRVTILATLISADDMNELFPERYGWVNGRPWSGTGCHGANVAYARKVTLTPP